MPKRRTTPNRPRDAMALAAKIGALATHEIEEDAEVPVDEAAKKRGDARAAKLSPAKRKKIAKKAATVRWSAKRKRDK